MDEFSLGRNFFVISRNAVVRRHVRSVPRYVSVILKRLLSLHSQTSEIRGLVAFVDAAGPTENEATI